MKLYTTATSPYGRLTRVAAIEHGLADRIDYVLARTREPDSPYYKINISGRVPYLVLSDGTSFEDALLICQYFDSVGDGPQLAWEWRYEDWAYGRLEAQARSFIDGTAVLGREVRRPQNEQSPTIVAHEEARANRFADMWETRVEEPMLQAPLNIAQLLITCAIDAAQYNGKYDLCARRPNLAQWHANISERPAMQATHPSLPL